MEFIYFVIGFTIGGLSLWYLTKLKLNVQKQALQTQLVTIQEAKEELLKVREENLDLSKSVTRLETENNNLIEKLGEQKQAVEALQEKFTIQFKNLANDLLEEKSKKFTEQNQMNLEGLLKPLGEKITAFEKKVEQTNKEGLAGNVALRTEINKLYELNAQVTKDAANLTNAIKGDTRMQGKWGEFILESILENSGLVKDREYFVQASFVTKEGKRYRPDVIVKLPEQKSIIIDAKVSLTSYEKFFNADHEQTRVLYLKQHIQSVKRHIQSLSERNYQGQYSLKGLDFVLMFIPIEPAFSLVVQHDSSFFSDAYQKNIILVAPSTLIATLRTIANIWKSEYQNQNALKIAQLGGALYDQFVSFIQDMQNIRRQLALSQRVYVEAMKKLYEGRDTLVSKAQHLKELGASASKSLDPKLVDYVKEQQKIMPSDSA